MSDMTGINKLWLPDGHHWDLHITHGPRGSGGGSFTGGGHKHVIHITVSGWNSADAMASDTVARRVEPTFVFGGRAGVEQPILRQLLPLDEAARALEHPRGPDTNRANCIQWELCAYDEATRKRLGKPASDSIAHWPESRYKALANAITLVNHRFAVPVKCPRSFTNTKRFTPDGFVKTAGLVGHMHAPNQDAMHGDPTVDFRGALLVDLINRCPEGGYRL